MTPEHKIGVIAGIGPGLGAALCRELAAAGYRVAGLARSEGAGAALSAELGEDRFLAVRCDLADAAGVDAAIGAVEARFGRPDLYIHNAARFHRQPFLETDPRVFASVWEGQLLGAVHGAQRVLPAMLERASGGLLFIGATASVKAGAGFSAFASAKFALRGLAQSLARELGPRGIHVAHLLIDGVIWGARARDEFGLTQAQCLAPEAVARTSVHLMGQDPSAWTHEIDIRPDRETF